MTASFADNEIWHVLLAADDMKRMNVEQLDDAFRLSLVDASTLVWKAGMKTWQRLGAVAGIDDEPKPSAPPPPPPPRPSPAQTQRLAAVNHAQAFQAQQAAEQQRALQQRKLREQQQALAEREALARHRALEQQALERQRALEQQVREQQRALQQHQQAYEQHLAQQRAHQEQAAYHARQAQAYQAQIARQTQLVQSTALARTAPTAQAFVTTQRTMPRPADPFALPQRAALSSEVDFRRRPRGGVRWGRWGLGLVLVALAVVALYRQNVLREAARRVGLERQYLSSEWRTTAYLTAKAPPGARDVLTSLKLLPGPNALPPLEPAPPPKPVVAPPPAPAPSPEPTAATTPSDATTAGHATTPSDATSPSSETGAAGVKPVSLDSLPTQTGAASVGASKPVSATPARTEPVERKAVRAPRPAPVTRAETAEPVAKAEPKPEEAKAEPKPRAEPPPPANESFLNAAIRQAIATDKAGKKK